MGRGKDRSGPQVQPTWEPEAHVAGAMDADGNIVTDAHWEDAGNAAADCSNIVIQNEERPRCPNCNKECKFALGIKPPGQGHVQTRQQTHN